MLLNNLFDPANSQALLGLGAGLLSGAQPGGTFAGGLSQGLLGMQNAAKMQQAQQIQEMQMRKYTQDMRLQEMQMAEAQRKREMMEKAQAGYAGLLGAAPVPYGPPTEAGVMGGTQGRGILSDGSISTPELNQLGAYMMQYPEIYGSQGATLATQKPVAPKFNYQDLGDKVAVIDETSGRITSYIPKGLAPKDQPGNVNQDWKEHEGKGAGFAHRMALADQNMSNATAAGLDPSSAWENAAIGTPLIGNFIASEKMQAYRQAQEDWVRAKLRKESGAVIGDEEMEREITTYFPQPGDNQKTVNQKAAARLASFEAMVKSSNGAYDGLFGGYDYIGLSTKFDPDNVAPSATDRSARKRRQGWSATRVGG